MGMLEPVVAIREFRAGDEDAFRRLNEEWITHYFVLEEKDTESLTYARANVHMELRFED